MHEVAELLTILLPDHVAPYPVKTLTYHQAFAQFLDIDIDTVSLESLAHIALSQCHYQEPQSNRHTLLDLLMGMLIGPQLGQQGLCFITDYPIEQAALARPQTHNPTVAARFEAYVSGIELANGFYELTDPLVQRQRFEADQQTRQERGQLPVPIDEEFLASLNKLPECAGVAMGLDRVLLLQLKQDHLKHIIPLSFYPFE
jgi:lysyl-tRNA synthetase class 2